MIYLGIDPGLTATGVGMIDDGGYLAHHTVRPKDEDTLSRLEEISVGLFGFLREKEVVGAGIFHKGILIAIEMPFWTPVTRNGKALMSQALTVGYLLAALGEVSDHEIREVHPNVVKRAVTGWGGGGFGRGRKPAPTKRQVQLCVQDILKLEKPPPQDAADALAVAIWLRGEVNLQTRITHA